ncbi:MAG: heme-binding domain-containing protein [bacterium]|nr:heme-binding domain-containing protein [bacterium]MCP4800043.1 heme-binding domain-containing protein [bacterium]
MKRIITIIILSFTIIVAASGLFAPRTNPPVQNIVIWDSPATEEQFQKSCADCHSNETKWPWYAYIGPLAFFVTQNVNEGRELFNISVPDMGDISGSFDEIIVGEMPPADYLMLHPEASLDDSQRMIFSKGLKSTFSQDEKLDEKHY